MKHIKLFENFMDSGMMESDEIVVGVISEGTDVAVFPREQGLELAAHLDTVVSNYYTPFHFAMKPGAKYLFIDARSSNPILPADQALLTEDELQNLMSTLDITVFLKNGEEMGMDIKDGYAIELVRGNQYMEIQSWGQELKDGAYEHFMNIASDEV